MTRWAALLLSVLLAQAGTAQPEFSQAQGSATPVKLTASDGTGLRLVSLKGRARVEGPLAFTQMHLTFANPESRTLEGRFEITLPEQAALSRLALRESGSWQEAEVVELARARNVFDARGEFGAL